MNNKKRNQKRTASEEFIQSYEKQLLDAFQESQPDQTQPTPTQEPSPQPISLSELEEAIADIDNYLQTQQQQASDAKD
jgi:hypothetical protein